jgi:hypothetical protein
VLEGGRCSLLAYLLAFSCTLDTPAECVYLVQARGQHLAHCIPTPCGVDNPIAHVISTYHVHHIAGLCAPYRLALCQSRLPLINVGSIDTSIGLLNTLFLHSTILHDCQLIFCGSLYLR